MTPAQNDSDDNGVYQHKPITVFYKKHTVEEFFNLEPEVFLNGVEEADEIPVLMLRSYIERYSRHNEKVKLALLRHVVYVGLGELERISKSRTKVYKEGAIRVLIDTAIRTTTGLKKFKKSKTMRKAAEESMEFPVMVAQHPAAKWDYDTFLREIGLGKGCLYSINGKYDLNDPATQIACAAVSEINHQTGVPFYIENLEYYKDAIEKLIFARIGGRRAYDVPRIQKLGPNKSKRMEAIFKRVKALIVKKGEPHHIDD